jgi:hypothetical protein
MRMAVRDQKLAENQRLFRNANERLVERVDEFSSEGASVPFLCECADADCLGRVDLTLSRYREVRSENDRYVILPEHPMVKSERVVEDNGHFHVVRKEA